MHSTGPGRGLTQPTAGETGCASTSVVKHVRTETRGHRPTQHAPDRGTIQPQPRLITMAERMVCIALSYAEATAQRGTAAVRGRNRVSRGCTAVAGPNIRASVASHHGLVGVGPLMLSPALPPHRPDPALRFLDKGLSWTGTTRRQATTTG